MEKQLLSVIICTHNRCKSLKDTLNSLLSQNVNEPFNYEIVVINNNSNDKTKHVVELCKNNANRTVKYFFELTQGLPYARNRGIKESSGELLVFTDDDVILDKNWLNNIWRTFQKFACDGVGGKIKPIWLDLQPSWCRGSNISELALLDYGDIPFEVTSKKYPFFGANFAFKRELFAKCGFFDTKSQGHSELPKGEDVEIFNRFFDNKAKLMYQPGVLVYHKIPPARLTKTYFRKWRFYDGKAYAARAAGSNKNLFGIPGWLLKDFIKYFILYLSNLMTFNRDKEFTYQLKIIHCVGAFSAFLKSRKVLKCR